ncbi:MAG: DUF1440 domain-containing protein [Pseudomonadota bacterium]|nr:DUF1440 domain-containing protein [Pseudomonadota bacterium]
MQEVMERPATTEMDPPEQDLGVVSKALMGAAAGAAGVWALDRVDWFMWNQESDEVRQRTTAVRPGGEPPAHVAASKLEHMFGLNPTPGQHAMAGLATHYGIGIAPAAVYALVRDKLPGKGPARGLLYGLGVFLMQDEALNAATGLGARPKDYPWQAHARGLVSHLVYGVVTELVLNMLEKSATARRQGPAVERQPQGV